MADLLDLGNKVLDGVNCIQKHVCKLAWRAQTCVIPMIRTNMYDALQPLLTILDTYSTKSKKKVEGKAEKKEIINKIIDLIIDLCTRT